MTMSTRWCAFCGRGDGETAIWVSTRGPAIGICIYCARRAIRALSSEPSAVVRLFPQPRPGEESA